MTVLLVPVRYLKDTVVTTETLVIRTGNAPPGYPRTSKGSRGISDMQGWWHSGCKVLCYSGLLKPKRDHLAKRYDRGHWARPPGSATYCVTMGRLPKLCRASSFHTLKKQENRSTFYMSCCEY